MNALDRPEAGADRGGNSGRPDRLALPGSSTLGRGLVKICGLRQPEHAAVAAGAGADLLGFIFAPARRRITPAAARAAIVAARAAAGDRAVLAVGVFVDAGADEINDVVALAGLDLVQLHGDEPPELLPRLTRPVIKAVRPPVGTASSAVEPLFARYMGVANAPRLFLVDGFVAGAAGGAGARTDWALARDLAASWPVSLAGGLTPEDIGEAIGAVGPLAVDVSSGVETAGEKDPAKIVAFIAGAKHAFSSVRSG